MAKHTDCINNPCSVCQKSVLDCQNDIFCESHMGWVHLKCTTFSNADYERLSISSDGWFCAKCPIDMFPFNVIDDDVDYLNCIFNIIKGKTIYTCHIKNAQQLKLLSKLKPVDSDIDRDKIFFELEISCNVNYYCDKEFNDFISLSNVPEDYKYCIVTYVA